MDDTEEPRTSMPIAPTVPDESATLQFGNQAAISDQNLRATGGDAMAETDPKKMKTEAVGLEALIAEVVDASDEKWAKRSAEADDKWLLRARDLLAEAGAQTDMGIEKAIKIMR